MSQKITKQSKLSLESIRSQFPVLERQVHGKDLVYFDNAATTQKPKSVIDALVGYYSGYNANIHRGIHSLAEEATLAYENTRHSLAQFLNASSSDEIILTKGTTESINLVAKTYGEQTVQEGDEILISCLEHHSNIVPWQMLCEKTGAKLKVIDINDQGELDLDSFEKQLSTKTKIVSVTFASNALGTVNPIKDLASKVHAVGAVIVVDGAQSTSHFNLDMQDLDIDFYAFSGHKMYGPTGVGGLYGKRALLEAMPPFMGGGEMIKEVTFEKTTYADLPHKYEAGTPNIADVIALDAAILFIQKIGYENIQLHEEELLNHATTQLMNIDGLTMYGTAKEKVAVASFGIESIHHQDLAILLDTYGIAVRTGHHCTQPLMNRLGILGTTRASFAVYNTIEEIDTFIAGLNKAVTMLR